MFDWISDAIDWIGDGISSLWDNTIGSAVDTITDAIWDVMFEWLFNLIYGAVADLFEFINASTSSIFALSWVQSFIALFHSLAWMLFVCGLIVAVFDTAIAYESGQANIKNTCLNVLKGFMAAIEHSVKLTDQQIQDIEKAISKKENKKVTLKLSIDSSLSK